MNQYLRERFENWVSDFCASELAARLPEARQAGGILVEFLMAASASHDGELSDAAQADMKNALTGTAAKFKMSEALLANFPDICAALLEHLEREGRLGGGRQMGQYLKSFRNQLNKPKTITRPGTKVGRNDPCPCGSGRKYKQCCINLLS